MQELIAKANQVILESQFLRREGRSLRFEAAALASELGQTIVRAQRTERESANLKTNTEQAFSDRAGIVEFSAP